MINRPRIIIPLFYLDGKRKGGLEYMSYSAIRCISDLSKEIWILKTKKTKLDEAFVEFVSRSPNVEIVESNRFGFNRFIAETISSFFCPPGSIYLSLNYFLPISFIFRKNVKTVVLFHDCLAFTKFNRNHVRRIWLYTNYLFSLFFADRRGTISEFSRSEICRLFNVFGSTKRRIFIIPNIIDSNRFAAADSEVSSYVAPNDDFVLLVSSDHPHKNLRAAVLGFLESELSRASKLHIVGNVNTATILDKHLAKQVVSSGSIRVFPFVNNSDLKSLYQCSIGVIVPSLYEGFGMPVAEGVYFSKLVLASDIPVFRDMSQNIPNVHLVSNPTEPNSWVNALTEIHFCKKKVSRCSREEIESRFGTTAVKEIWRDFLQADF